MATERSPDPGGVKARKQRRPKRLDKRSGQRLRIRLALLIEDELLGVHQRPENVLIGRFLGGGVLANVGQRRSKRPTTASECEQEVKCSPRKILIAIREEITSAPRRRRLKYEERLRQAQGERRQRTSAKASRVWPRRKPHKPPKPPQLRKLSNAQKSELARRKSNAA